MKSKGILEEINKGFLFVDGSCGTLLQGMGLQPGELPETWNIRHPERIKAMHRAYLEAGANVLTTNSFGASPLHYSGEGEFSLEAVTSAAVKLAREAIDEFEASGLPFSDEPHFVALDIGPLGKLLKPFGDLDFEDAAGFFKKTVEAGCEGADLVLVETMNDIYEAKAAVLAAKESCGLPVVLTCAFDEGGKLLTGSSPRIEAAVAEGLGACALGVNCSLGPEAMLPIVEELCRYASVPVWVSPNAGLPRSENGKTVYDVTAEDFTASMVKIAQLGARVLGGCCGTNPEFIRQMRAAVSRLEPKPVTFKNDTLITSYSRCVEFGAKTVIIGERINPTGKKRFKQALREHDIEYILQEGANQQDAGAEVLDVNVGLPEIDEPAMMAEVTGELQAVTELPLQIDSTDPAALESALRLYNGKAMINSVNGKAEVMDAVFPIAAKYGGLIVALTLDESGIPETAEGRVAIAEKICARAAEYGIHKKDLIIVPLAMTVSSDPHAAEATLGALEQLREKGFMTSLGVSNISFGLPERRLLNSAFLTLAMDRGLGAAIMNPGSPDMMNALRSFNALRGLDPAFEAYIEQASKQQAPAAGPANAAPAAPVPGSAQPEGIEDPLITAIRKGLKDHAARLTGEALQTLAPIEVIDTKLIPALDIVGKGFENKTVFLPQLLMAAEAASECFGVIKAKLASEGSGGAPKGRIVLATVKGDIHDIGKNIVKVLLENYGYEVIDLGKDVPPELVVETAKAENIRLVGLSALMTTTVPAMEETIKQLRSACPGTKVVVGGAVLTQEYADMIGADKYAKDAMETVRYAEEIFA
jgi:5-methyltetrahydrofolate--homocysteine methyltransferase